VLKKKEPVVKKPVNEFAIDKAIKLITTTIEILIEALISSPYERATINDVASPIKGMLNLKVIN